MGVKMARNGVHGCLVGCFMVLVAYRGVDARSRSGLSEVSDYKDLTKKTGLGNITMP